jgi:hypothetical protein
MLSESVEEAASNSHRVFTAVKGPSLQDSESKSGLCHERGAIRA